jgi:hypothetical protein
LQPSTTYYYYIKAVNSAGESGYSAYKSATTSSSGGGTTGPQTPYSVSLVRNNGLAYILMTFDTASVSKSVVDTYTFTIQFGGTSGSTFMDVYTYTPPNTAAVTTGLPAGWTAAAGNTSLSGSDYSVLGGAGEAYTGARFQVKITKGSQSIYTAIKTY